MDIRELTRAINRLHDVVEALNRNLVVVESRSKPPEIFARKLATLCSYCESGKCPDELYNRSCSCCKRNHDTPK